MVTPGQHKDGESLARGDGGRELSQVLPRHDLTQPITSGPTPPDIRYTLAHRQADLCRDLKRIFSDAPESPPPSASRPPLVYSAISQQTPSDPVYEFDLYPVSVKVKRGKIENPNATPPPDRTGTSLDGFSTKSRSRLRFVAANSAPVIKSQFCMTYGDVWPINARSLKSDLNTFLTNIRRKFDDVHYIWIAEFQTRGAPHFHLFSNIPVTPENHEILTETWHRIAGYGQDKHLHVHAHANNFIEWDMGNGAYLCKYLDKEAQKYIPEGFYSLGRWWGNSRNLKPSVIKSVSVEELKIFGRIDKPVEYVTRQLGRYAEKVNPRSNIRRTPQTRTVLTGATIAEKLINYVMKGGETMAKNFDFCRQCGAKVPIGATCCPTTSTDREPCADVSRGGATRANGDPLVDLGD